MTALNYFRYTAYALIAIGLINLRYQSGKSDLTSITVFIVGAGVLVFALTYLKFGQKFLATALGKSITAIFSLSAALIAILN